MLNIIKSELYRMIKSRKNKVLFILFIIVFVLFGLYIRLFNVGFYSENITTSLNSLNTPPFIMREFHLFLLYVFCPMIFIESFNHENTSGAYRMIMTRGYSKKEYIISKFISCALVTGVFMVIIFALGTLFGYMFMNTVESTSFFNIKGNFNKIDALLYNFKFYTLEYLIVLAFLGISSVISILSKNSVIAYFLSLGVCLASIYVSDGFDFFLGSSKIIFDVLSGANSIFIMNCIIIILVTIGLSIFTFSKKDYLN